MGRWSEPLAAACCALLFLLWRFGYPVTSWAALSPLVALLLVGAGIWLRRVRLTTAMREGIFLPQARYKNWFTGRVTGLIIATIEGTAIVVAISHFALRAIWPELLLAAAIGVSTLAAIALLRRVLVSELRPEFAVAASAWIAAGVALPFCILHFWMQQNILPSPAYLEVSDFLDAMNGSLAELPSRRDGIIEVLSAMQLLEATVRWMLASVRDLWGTAVLLFSYNAMICIAIARFFADISVSFNVIRAQP